MFAVASQTAGQSMATNFADQAANNSANQANDLADFDYALPTAQIAQHPAARRDSARLLDVCATTNFRACRIATLPSLLNPGDVLVANDSRVFPARLSGHKESGGKIEIFAERFLPDGGVLAQVRASRPPSLGARLIAGGGIFIVVAKTTLGFYHLQSQNKQGAPVDARRRFLRHGQTPLPPYIRRAPTAADRRRYQTIFARALGSAAAPTAGLHFTPPLLQALAARGISIVRITLHVGAGTFMPLRRGLAQNKLHPETFRISPLAAARINAAKKRGGRIIAAGTTTLRALESAADKHGIRAAAADTTLFIKPGYDFRTADLLLTNFHLPRSSLLVLACAFGGTHRVMRAYRWAVQNNFRFYSYGDAMLLSRG